jgi:formate/nitrite transporter FocA (FNT family)
MSPIVQYFFDHFKEAIHDRQIRFFGMEHITVMFISIIIITLGSIKAKKQTTDVLKFKTMAIWFTIALILIISSIPWAFSPLVSRPYFRPF